ncbi:cytochrome P450 6k1-like [Epargyreus clarus]|uniref:cytochrome P450 6k1-like n=1 Tax=Epargyreus clarus TaxID=520877 RepID=UPI003C2C87D2
MSMMIVSAVVLVIIAWVYTRWKQVRHYWAKRRVPYLPPHPLLGSLTFLQKENPALWMRRVYEHFKEPYVGIWLFWRPALIINSTEIARNILTPSDANLFRNRFVTSGNTDPMGKYNIFAVKDPLWSRIRRCLTVLFTGSRLRALQNIITAKSKELVQRIEKDRQKTKFVDIRVIFTDFTTDIIGVACFGVANDATLTGDSALRSITKKLMSYSPFRALSWCSAFFFPELIDILRLKVIPTDCTESLRKILRNIIAQRGGYETKVTESKDLVDILLKMKQEGDDEDVDMNEDILLAQVVAFLQAGFDTTATTITFAIYELAYNPDIQDKLLKELQKAKEEHGDNILEIQVLSQLKYLNAVIDETLRKYPQLGWLDRTATVDYKIDDHLTITAGTPVYVNAVGMHYNPDYYPEPDRFNPDRFLPENVGNIKPFTYMPFGEGPRSCIGKRFGLYKSRTSVAAIILNYEVRPIANTPRPSEVELEKNGLFLSPGEVLYVEFIPRN